MSNSPLKLSDLIALQAENKAVKANLKTVTEIKLDQIPLFDQPQQHGGNREGCGRKSSAEKTAVVRVPVGCLAAVQQLIAEYRNPNLKTVTEIKLPEGLEDRRRPRAPPRYRLVVDGVEHLWSGRGRIPVEYQHYAKQQGCQGRDCLQALLIEGVQP
ncbi:hypothetical protein [Thiothrix fructosivorans]|uniref:Uncharacterized protein n=1 Tax=Thiothrix fructosivorans TaxID=111770 RepID=A0A8B0SK71_9GAMM|nr:hypothetical protein [Thiothrix fructosivorans]MBO0615394.1 hypothetical protein [Thiothrix fructosivorans]QTX10167.1 hypothetical protein J1836_016465 [Thiothrix fructosivorans]